MNYAYPTSRSIQELVNNTNQLLAQEITQFKRRLIKIEGSPAVELTSQYYKNRFNFTYIERGIQFTDQTYLTGLYLVSVKGEG